MVLYSESAAKKERDAIAEFEKKALSVQSEPKKPILEYNNRTWKSWVNLGIPDIIDRIPHNVEAPETRKKIFLSRVDLEQGPIQRKITMMVRRKAKNQGEDSKEYLVHYNLSIAFTNPHRAQLRTEGLPFNSSGGNIPFCMRIFCLRSLPILLLM
jgi:hypothetical protein